MNYVSAFLLLFLIAGAIAWALGKSPVIRAVFFRNVVSYFSGMLGYLIIVVFVMAGGFFAYRDQFFANNLANLDQLSLFFPWLLLFIVPAITMSVWADEKKMGTDELLFTLPARDTEILIGKYLAVLAVYTVALVFSITHTMVLGFLGDPDWGVLLTTFIGYWVAGASLLAAGMVASALTGSTTVAFVLGSMICAVPVGLGSLGGNYTTLRQLSIGEQLYGFSNGLLSLAALAYFGSLIGFMLYVNKVLISRRHWSAGQAANMGGQYAARIACLAVGLVSLNLVAIRADTTIDLTSERIYSLSDATREMIKKIPTGTSIRITAFLSDNVPRQYVPVRKRLIGLLRQFDQIGGKKISFTITSIEPFSDQAEQAEQKGIIARQVRENRAGKINVEDIFLGVVISGADEVVIPFFDVGLPLEYELTRSIRTASEEQNRRPRIGILDTDAKVFGSFSFAGGMPRQIPQWQVIRELEKQYEVESVDPNGPIDRARYDVLLAMLPSSLTTPQLSNFVDYVTEGNPVLIFDDPLPYGIPGGASLSPRQPKPPPPGGGMMGMGRPPSQPKAFGGKATSLIEALGLEWDHEEVVWAESNPHPQFGDLPKEFVFIAAGGSNPKAFHRDSAVSRGLQEIVLFFPGSVRANKNSKLRFVPLLQTVANSGLHRWDNLVDSGFQGIQFKRNPSRKPDKFAHVLAMHIEGHEGGSGGDTDAKPADPAARREVKIKCIFVADVDLISDQMFLMREQGLQPSEDAEPIAFDNVTFLLNAIDVLIDDTDLIPLRIRRARHRTLTRVEDAKDKSLKAQLKEQASAEKKFETRLKDKQAQLDKEVKEIESRKDLDETAKFRLMAVAQAQKNQELQQERDTIEQDKQAEMRQIHNKTEREVRAIESGYKWAGIGLPPLPAILIGILFFLRQLTNEQKNVSPDRRRA